MEVVSQSWPKNRIMCPHCHAVLDVKGADIDKHFAFGTYDYSVECPCCRKTIELKDDFWSYLYDVKGYEDEVGWATTRQIQAKDSYRRRQSWSYLRSL